MEVRSKIATVCFFPVVTSHLLMAVMEVVVCPFAIMTGTDMGGFTKVVLILGIFFMFSFFHMGQTFIDKVRGVQNLDP